MQNYNRGEFDDGRVHVEKRPSPPNYRPAHKRRGTSVFHLGKPVICLESVTEYPNCRRAVRLCTRREIPPVDAPGGPLEIRNRFGILAYRTKTSARNENNFATRFYWHPYHRYCVFRLYTHKAVSVIRVNLHVFLKKPMQQRQFFANRRLVKLSKTGQKKNGARVRSRANIVALPSTHRRKYGSHRNTYGNGRYVDIEIQISVLSNFSSNGRRFRYSSRTYVTQKPTTVTFFCTR